MITKEQYIQIKSVQPIGIVYEYYKEHLDVKKHKMLGAQEFFTFVQMWGSLDELFKKVSSHYDAKFNIVTLSDVHGNLIKYL